MNRKTTIPFLEEEHFEQQMKQVVEPFLAKHNEKGFFLSSDGTRISYTKYLAEKSKGKILFIHGFSEFSEKYNEMIYYFLQAGYSVYLPELRGHGDSERKVADLSLVHVETFEEYVEDIHVCYQQIFQTSQPELKEQEYLFAHSMGGAIGALYIEKYPTDFQKAILSSPMIRMRTGKFPFPAAFLFSSLQKRTGHGKQYAAGQRSFPNTPDFVHSSCTSKARYDYTFQKRQQNEQYQTWGSSYAWVNSACKASLHILKKRNCKRISIPVLVFAASQDHMVKPEYIKKFAARVKYATCIEMQGAKHEIFHGEENVRRNFYQIVFSFFEKE